MRSNRSKRVRPVNAVRSQRLGKPRMKYGAPNLCNLQCKHRDPALVALEKSQPDSLIERKRKFQSLTIYNNTSSSASFGEVLGLCLDSHDRLRYHVRAGTLSQCIEEPATRMRSEMGLLYAGC